jgi:hypothetical protein
MSANSWVQAVLFAVAVAVLADITLACTLSEPF